MAGRSSAYSGDDNQRREHVFKVLVIGDAATGKTSLVTRYVHNHFSEHYKTTIGVDFALKLVKVNDGTFVRLQLWDIAGQERFGSMMRVYYKEAVGCIIVFDVTRRTTFEAVSKWKADLDKKVELPNGNRVPCILLANKCDLPKDDLFNNVEKMNSYCQEKGFDKWFETSAKENSNIDTAIQYLVGEIMKQGADTLVRSSKPNDGQIKLIGDEESSNKKREGGCCGGKS